MIYRTKTFVYLGRKMHFQVEPNIAAHNGHCPAALDIMQ